MVGGLKRGVAGQYVLLLRNISRYCEMFSEVQCVCRGRTSSPVFGIVSLSHFGQTGGCKVVFTVVPVFQVWCGHVVCPGQCNVARRDLSLCDGGEVYH